MIRDIGNGWTPARIDIGTTEGKQTRPGLRKGSFGIVEINMETNQVGWLSMASLTHLGTGWRVAVFSNLEEAALAGELAEQCGDWSALTDPASSRSPEWSTVKDRMVKVWEEAGICQCFTANNGQPIWAKP
jgi:hypothetical protein